MLRMVSSAWTGLVLLNCVVHGMVVLDPEDYEYGFRRGIGFPRDYGFRSRIGLPRGHPYGYRGGSVFPRDAKTNSVSTSDAPPDTTTDSVFANAVKTDTAIDSVGANAVTTDTATDSVGANAVPTDTATESVGANAVPTDTVSDSVGATAVPTDTATDSVGANAVLTDTATDSVGANAVLTDTATNSVNANAVPTDTVSNSVGATAVPTDTATDFVGANAVPTDATNTNLYKENSLEGSESKFVLTDGKYYIYRIELNWFQAMEMCILLGKRSATFTTEAEYKQLTDLIRRNEEFVKEGKYWTGGSELGQSGKFVWMPTGRPISHAPWNSGEPNSGGSYMDRVGKEHCIELKGENYRMNDKRCERPSYVVCENIN